MGCCHPKAESNKELPLVFENESRVKHEMVNSVLISSNSSMQEPNYNVKYRPRKEKEIKVNAEMSSDGIQLQNKK